MAPQISSAPITIAQPAINISKTNAVSPGDANATNPARRPTIPTTASHHRGANSAPLPEIAAHNAMPPSRYTGPTPEVELAIIDVYERQRWPERRFRGGKG